ncbi:MAG TPA: SRPBCC family protein [bacterium]|nr:SRPBCC family protein [bacterium]
MKRKSMKRKIAAGAMILTAWIMCSCAATMSGVVIADVKINAPVEEVFAYLADCRHLPEYIPEVVSVRNISGEGQGMTFDWTIESKGTRSEGRTVVVDFVPNQRIVWNTTCGKIVTLLFQPAPDGGTRLTLSVMYASEVPIEGQAVKRYVDNSTRAMFEGMLRNVKAELEK